MILETKSQNSYIKIINIIDFRKCFQTKKAASPRKMRLQIYAKFTF
jgi:hypothetical protein